MTTATVIVCQLKWDEWPEDDMQNLLTMLGCAVKGRDMARFTEQWYATDPTSDPDKLRAAVADRKWWEQMSKQIAERLEILRPTDSHACQR